MNRRKIFFPLFLLVFTLFIGLGSSEVHAKAFVSDWHNGLPTQIRGHWRTKMHRVNMGKGKHVWDYEYETISQSAIKGAYIHSDNFLVKKTIYRDFGNFIRISGTGVPGDEGVQGTYSHISKNKMIYQPDMGRKQTFYRFSGKISKHTCYPYPI